MTEGSVVFDSDEFHDYVAAHGMGSPTEKGLDLGRKFVEGGDDYATASFEVVFRSLVVDCE